MSAFTNLPASGEFGPPSNIVKDSLGRWWVCTAVSFKDSFAFYYSDDQGVTWTKCATQYRPDGRNIFWGNTKWMALGPNNTLVVYLCYSGGAAGGPAVFRATPNAGRTDMASFQNLNTGATRYFGWNLPKSGFTVIPHTDGSSFAVLACTYDPGSSSGVVRSNCSFDVHVSGGQTGTQSANYAAVAGSSMDVVRKVDADGEWVGGVAGATAYFLAFSNNNILIVPASTSGFGSGVNYTVSAGLNNNDWSVRGAWDSINNRMIVLLGLYNLWAVTLGGAATAIPMPSSTGFTFINSQTDVEVDHRGRIHIYALGVTAAGTGLHECVYDGTSWGAWTYLFATQSYTQGGFLNFATIAGDFQPSDTRRLPVSGFSYASNGAHYPFTGYQDGATATTTPTSLTPAAGKSFDRALDLPFTWDFTDQDPGDTQTKYEFRYRVGTGAFTTAAVTSTTSQHVIPGGTLAANTYGWQVRAAGKDGLFSDWSAERSFTARDAPAAPVITAPPNGATVPRDYADLVWTSSVQQWWQARRVADASGSPAPGTVYADTGTVQEPGTRSVQVAFPTNGRAEHLQLRIAQDEVWSAWASVRQLVQYNVPDAAVVSVQSASTGTPRIVVAVSWARGSTYGTAAADVERSTDGGTTWTAKGTVPLGSSGDGLATLEDVDLPTGSTASYRARVFLTMGNAQRVNGALSNVSSARFEVYADYLVNLTTGVSSVARLQVYEHAARPWFGEVVYPLEGDTAIILSGRQYKREGSAVAAFRTWTAALQLETALLGIYPLLWRRPPDTSGWQRPDTTIRVRPGSVRVRPADASLVRWAACVVEFDWITQ